MVSTEENHLSYPLFLSMMRYESGSTVNDVVNNIAFGIVSDAAEAQAPYELATKIAERVLGRRNLDLAVEEMNPKVFSAGEFCPQFNVRNGHCLAGKSVYIFLVPDPHLNPEGLVYRAGMNADAAKNAGAEKVVLLATDLPHSRQDRDGSEDEKAKGESNTARLHARLFSSFGIDEVITTHVHSPRLAAFYAIEYDDAKTHRSDLLLNDGQLLASSKLVSGKHFDPNNLELQSLGKRRLKSISPHALLADYILHHSLLAQRGYLDNGGAKLVVKAMDRGNTTFIDCLGDSLFLSNLARMYCDKARTAKNDPRSVEVKVVRVSDNLDTLDGRVELFADDGLDTAGTMIKAVQWSQAGNLSIDTQRCYGTPLERFVYFTHPWLGGKDHVAIQRKMFYELPAMELVSTNSRPFFEGDQQFASLRSFTTVLRLAELWANAIIANELGIDVTTRYQGFESEAEQHEFMSELYALRRHTRHVSGAHTHSGSREVKFALR